MTTQELLEKRNQFQPGDLVFFKDTTKGTNIPFTNCGLVIECYQTEVWIDLLDTNFTATVLGTPIKDFLFPSRWRKLPKNWSNPIGDGDFWDYYKRHYVPLPLEYQKVKFDEKILRQLIDCGYYCTVAENDYTKVEKQIDKHSGWRIIKSFSQNYPKARTCLTYDKVFKTIQEVEDVIAAEKKELDRIANMTDYEYQVEQINRHIHWYGDRKGLSEADMQEVLERFQSMENFEDIETRVSHLGIEWKYIKNKKWILMEF